MKNNLKSLYPKISLFLGVYSLLLLAHVEVAKGQSFSVDDEPNQQGRLFTDLDLRTPPPDPNSIYFRGGFGNLLDIDHPDLGLPPLPNQLNSLSAGYDPLDAKKPWDFKFSVDRNSVGVPGSAVNIRQPLTSASDIFWTGPMRTGNNFLSMENFRLGLKSALVDVGDNLDGAEIIDSRLKSEPLYGGFTNNGDTPYFSQNDANIYIPMADGMGGFDPLLVYGGGAIGLQAGDVIDALALDASILQPFAQMGGFEDQFNFDGVDEALFSLAPGSPSLDGPDGINGTPDDLSAADIFITSFNGVFSIAQLPGWNDPLNHTALGLLFDDNVDAIDLLWSPTNQCNLPMNVQPGEQPDDPACNPQDFGDAAPDTYRTLLASDGPRYDEGDFQRLGLEWDSERDGQPNPAFFGDDLRGPADDDEDGVIFGPSWVDVTFNINRPGDNLYQLRAWWDFEMDNVFDHPGNLVIDDLLTLDMGILTKRYDLGFDPTDFNSRFRLTLDPIDLDVKPWGEYFSNVDCMAGNTENCISHGEVEDYPKTPEPTSSISLLALGILGGGAILKRKLKPFNSTEK